jgi:hypothetical protein
MKNTSRDYSKKSHMVFMFDNNGWSDISETNTPTSRIRLLKRDIKMWEKTGLRAKRLKGSEIPSLIQFTIVPRDQVREAVMPTIHVKLTSVDGRWTISSPHWTTA